MTVGVGAGVDVGVGVGSVGQTKTVVQAVHEEYELVFAVKTLA